MGRKALLLAKYLPLLPTSDLLTAQEPWELADFTLCAGVVGMCEKSNI